MRAAVLHGAGDIRVEDVPYPSAGPGEIVLRTLAATTCGTDRKVARRGYHARILRPPALLGHEVTGEVIAVGVGVPAGRIGAHVVAANSAPCGSCRFCAAGRESLCDDLFFWNGAFAEACRVPARVVARNVIDIGATSPVLAAMTEPLSCCLKGIEDAAVSPGQRLLVIGLGPIGLMLVALARLRGADVTASARRAGARELARSLGAAAALPYADLPGHTREFDVVFDAGGSRETVEQALRSVGRGGTVSLFAGCPTDTLVEVNVTRAHYEEIRILGSFHHTPRHFREAFDLIASGRVDLAPLVTERIRLDDLAAHLLAPADGRLKAALQFA
jgi:L-iditol 2-dehydrogenase